MPTITLHGGPYHAETRPVPEPPGFTDRGPGLPSKPAYYYAFHRRPDGSWAPTAIYIQDPYRADLFHYYADTTPKE